MITNEYNEKVFAKSFYPEWDIWTEKGGNGYQMKSSGIGFQCHRFFQ